MTTQLPQGWTVRQTRFLWALVDPSGTDRSFGLTEAIVRNAIHLQPEFGGVVLSSRDPGDYRL